MISTVKNLAANKPFLLMVAVTLTSILVLFPILLIQTTATSNFVIRKGSNLYVNGKLFRFSGANIYWLGLDENVNGIAYPSPFRIDDALATAQEMGATVVRSHTLGISVGCKLCIKPSLHTYNDQAFQSIDYAIKAAKARNLRLIIPLTDHWKYYHGGKHTFTNWRGLENEDEFYTNPVVIQDFKEYISYILNRVNPYTGLAYKDDPTIMAWETGNELQTAPSLWTQLIADHIKSIAPHQLVADGKEVKGDSRNLHIASVDLYTDHFYPLDNEQMLADAALVKTYHKVFYIGEYDWSDRQAKQAQGTITQDSTTAVHGNSSAKVRVTQSSRDWHIQLQQGEIAVAKGNDYTLTFWAKASAPREINIVVQQNYSPWTVYTEYKGTLSTYWRQYTFSFTPAVSEQDTLIAVNLADTMTDVWLDAMSFSSTSSGNLLQNNSFEPTGQAWLSPWYFDVKTNTADTFQSFLPLVEDPAHAIAGDLFWSLFGHDDTFGFVQHYDGFTLHYPGETPDMQQRGQLLRKHAYSMSGRSVPQHRCPNAPVLKPLTQASRGIAVAWRGSVGAKSYVIQRSQDIGKSWQTVQTGVTDYDAPWIDTSGSPFYQYRIQGVNLAGVGGAFSDGTTTTACKSMKI